MHRVFLLFLFGMLLTACGSDSQSGGFQSTPVSGEISNADLIRNPISEAGQLDSSRLAKITFTESIYDFGEATVGDKIEKKFAFTNTGKVPLLITDARSTCGCTVADWPRQPILPGESGTIAAEFNTENKEGYQNKPITISANTFPSQTIIRIVGNVIE